MIVRVQSAEYFGRYEEAHRHPKPRKKRIESSVAMDAT